MIFTQHIAFKFFKGRFVHKTGHSPLLSVAVVAKQARVSQVQHVLYIVLIIHPPAIATEA